MRSIGTVWRRLAARSFRRLGEELRGGLPGYCTFCMGWARDGLPWCEACYRSMPWNRYACRRCAEPRESFEVVTAHECGRCLRHPPAFDTVFAPLRYEARLTTLIQRFKFSADPRAGEVLVRLLVSAHRSLLQEGGLENAAIVGVPGQRDRTRERGFDHVAWLAGRLGSGLGLPVYTAIRQRETPTQRGLDRRARQRNVKAAFAVNFELPEVVIALDDVMTTGATLDSLAKTCRQAGATRVVGFACARTPSKRI